MLQLKEALEKTELLERLRRAERGKISELFGKAADEIERLTALINTPLNSDWIEGVKIEAAHQQERWGSDNDVGKTAIDWFWLLGYLAGKTVSAANAGDIDKALHHTISSGAALLNWYRALRSDPDAKMRPGIIPPDRPVK